MPRNTVSASPKRVWVVSELYAPEETSTGHYATGIAEGLAGSAEVGAVVAQPSYSRRGLKAPRREVRNGVRVHRVRSTTLDKNSAVGKAINSLTSASSRM